MNILEKIQNSPERIRKTIFWTVIIIVGIFLLVWWSRNTALRIESLRVKDLKEELRIPFLEEELKEMPKIETPEITEEELKKLEEIIRESLKKNEE